MFFGKLYRAIRYMTPQQIREGSKIPPPPPPPPARRIRRDKYLACVKLEYDDGSVITYQNPKNMKLEIEL